MRAQDWNAELDKSARALQQALEGGGDEEDDDEIPDVGSEPPLGEGRSHTLNFTATIGAHAMAFPHLFARNGKADITVPRYTSVGSHLSWLGYLARYCWRPDPTIFDDLERNELQHLALQRVPDLIRHFPARDDVPYCSKTTCL